MSAPRYGVTSGMVSVHRDDARMFELAGDLRLLEKARPERGLLGPFRPQLLEGDVPAQVAVVGQPDATDAAGRVQAQPAIALGWRGHMVNGNCLRLGRKGPS